MHAKLARCRRHRARQVRPSILLKDLESRYRPQRHPGHRPAHRWPRHQNRAPDRRRSGRAATRAHGSALFTRGETQALCVVTSRHRVRTSSSWTPWKASTSENFMLHYNFPPFSVGEAGRMGSPGRREIGHGKLAWRAIHPLLPAKEDFPYTLRIVSPRSWRATAVRLWQPSAAARLRMMDGGVPLKRPVRRHRHGPDQGRSRLCGALRHPG